MCIPPGFNTITPYSFVVGAEAFVDFLLKGPGGVQPRSPRPALAGCVDAGAGILNYGAERVARVSVDVSALFFPMGIGVIDAMLLIPPRTSRIRSGLDEAEAGLILSQIGKYFREWSNMQPNHAVPQTALDVTPAAIAIGVLPAFCC